MQPQVETLVITQIFHGFRLFSWVCWPPVSTGGCMNDTILRHTARCGNAGPLYFKTVHSCGSQPIPSLSSLERLLYILLKALNSLRNNFIGKPTTLVHSPLMSSTMGS